MENYSPPSEDSSEDEPPRKRVRGGKGPAKKKKDPNAPKNPMNAYFFYVKENRESYKAKHSDLKMTEITKALGQQWKEMSEKEREVCHFR
jgi:structure-specific recognition protein 1